jgi:hypothetical protein
MRSCCKIRLTGVQAREVVLQQVELALQPYLMQPLLPQEPLPFSSPRQRHETSARKRSRSPGPRGSSGSSRPSAAANSRDWRQDCRDADRLACDMARDEQRAHAGFYGTFECAARVELDTHARRYFQAVAVPTTEAADVTTLTLNKVAADTKAETVTTALRDMVTADVVIVMEVVATARGPMVTRGAGHTAGAKEAPIAAVAAAAVTQ